MLWWLGFLASVIPVLILAALAEFPLAETAGPSPRRRRTVLVIGLAMFVAVKSFFDSQSSDDKLQFIASISEQLKESADKHTELQARHEQLLDRQTNMLRQQQGMIAGLGTDVDRASEELKVVHARSIDALKVLAITNDSIILSRIQAADWEKTQAGFDKLLCGMETVLELVGHSQKEMTSKTERFINETSFAQDPDSVKAR